LPELISGSNDSCAETRDIDNKKKM